MRANLLIFYTLLLLGCPQGRMGDEEDLASGASDGSVPAGDLAPTLPVAFLDLDTLYQDCMPPARPDPLLLKGRITVRNTGGATLGPVLATEGSIFDRDGKQVAAFALAPLDLGTIGPNGSVEGRVFEKRSGTLMPATGCQALKCNEPVRVEVALSGTNVLPGAKAKSASYNVVCAF